MSKAAPSTIGPFRVLRPLGHGGMGAVYLVEDPRTGAQRALKTLGPGADLEARRRFAREAEAMARVDDHPHVLRIHAAGEHEGVPYLVMAHAPGGDLAARLKGGPLPPAEVVRLGVALAGGLAHVHARGVLHRDLKPSNVLFDEADAPRLVDFGLAKLVAAERLTQSGTILGTPAYMAPEQANASAGFDARADVYGLGALLYHALTGRPPFQGASAWAVIDRVLREPPVAPSALAPGVPPALEAAILRALAKSPDDRFASAEAFAAALQATEFAPTRRGRGPLVAAAALLVMVTALVVLAMLRRDDEGSPTGEAPVASATHEVDAERALLEVTLADLAAERPAGVFEKVAAQRADPDHPLASVVVAAARLAEDDALVPAAWQPVVRDLRGRPLTLLQARVQAAGEELASVLKDAGRVTSTEAQHECVERAEKALGRLRDAVEIVADDPQGLALTILAQRATLGEVERAIELTLKTSTQVLERLDRQQRVTALLRDVAALAPSSLTALALRVASCRPALDARSLYASAWSQLESEHVHGRDGELAQRSPEVIGPRAALWIVTGRPSELAGRWEEVEARWEVARRPEAYGTGELRVQQVRFTTHAALARANVALWRAWPRRGTPDLVPALDVAASTTHGLADLDRLWHGFFVARVHLLRGDGAATSSVLDASPLAGVPLDALPGLRFHLLRAERDLLVGAPKQALGRLDEVRLARGDAALEPFYYHVRAVTLSLLGRPAEAADALRATARLPDDLINGEHVEEFPPWSREHTLLRVEAAARGWRPWTSGRVYALEGDVR